MNPEARDRLFNFLRAFDHPVTLAITLGLVALLLAVPIVVRGLVRLGKLSPELKREIDARYFSWLIIVPAILIPILLGAAWMIVGIGLLSLLCYYEYARATGLFRFKAISLMVTLGIIATTFAVFDHWYRLFAAISALTACCIAAVALLADEPKGYIQRVALGIVGFLLFGTCFGYLAYMGNDPNYRPLVLLVILAVELNDVFAFVVGKSLGGPKLCPKTSPNKTISGSLGAIVLTTLLVTGIGWFVVRYMNIEDKPDTTTTLRYCLVLGLIISVVGQLGDLMVSSIKRDLGLKDMGNLIPGHGGLLDRFDSLILVSPAVFLYLNYVAGIGLHEPIKILTGG
jgi:phosphatidate cytidylyltransferase